MIDDSSEPGYEPTNVDIVCARYVVINVNDINEAVSLVCVTQMHHLSV